MSKMEINRSKIDVFPNNVKNIVIAIKIIAAFVSTPWTLMLLYRKIAASILFVWDVHWEIQPNVIFAPANRTPFNTLPV